MNHEPENAAPEKWVNLEDIAEHLSLSTDTVRTWVKKENYRSIVPANDINSKSLRSMNGLERAKLKNRPQRRFKELPTCRCQKCLIM